jgi:hypothetical protein
VDPFFGPWVDYECENCLEYNLICLGTCCAWCGLTCLSGNLFLCISCVSAFCGFLCFLQCCSRWGTTCCGCPESGVP